MAHLIIIFISIFLALYTLTGIAATVSQIQEQLQTLGYPIGKVDGHWGKKSRDALKRFQTEQGLSATGKIDEFTEQTLKLIVKEKAITPVQSQTISAIANPIKDTVIESTTTALPIIPTPPPITAPTQNVTTTIAPITPTSPVITPPILTPQPITNPSHLTVEKTTVFTTTPSPPIMPLPLPVNNSVVNTQPIKTAIVKESISIEIHDGIKFVKVPGGCFTMGGGIHPAHEVCVHKDSSFLISQYEITQGQWQAINGDNPSSHVIDNDYPVENVSWNDVQSFIAKINKQKSNHGRYRLPTEAEWEYSTRAKTNTAYWWGTNQPTCKPGMNNGANFNGGNACDNATVKVGSYKANAFGLYDVHGNVWEWVEDVYLLDAYKRHAKHDPIIIEGGIDRVFRGGSWLYPAEAMTVFNRDHAAPNFRFSHLGLRLIYASK